MTAILRVRDENGNIVDIPAIKGKDGKDGVDGYTPIKGVDYYTEAEQKELLNEIQEQQNFEQWIFTLEDGTEIVKEVYVK